MASIKATHAIYSHNGPLKRNPFCLHKSTKFPTCFLDAQPKLEHACYVFVGCRFLHSLRSFFILLKNHKHNYNFIIPKIRNTASSIYHLYDHNQQKPEQNGTIFSEEQSFSSGVPVRRRRENGAPYPGNPLS